MQQRPYVALRGLKSLFHGPSQKCAHRCRKPLHFQQVCYEGADSGDMGTITGVSDGQTLDTEYHATHPEKPQLLSSTISIPSLMTIVRSSDFTSTLAQPKQSGSNVIHRP